MKKTLIVLSLAALLASCGGEKTSQTDTTNAVTLDFFQRYAKDSIMLEDIAQVEYITLDVSRAPLEKEQDPKWNAFCSISSSDIFLKAAQDVYHFNRQGKYLGKLTKKSGNYKNMKDLAVDTLAKEIIIYDNFDAKFHFYNYNLKHVRSVAAAEVENFRLFGADNKTAFCTTPIIVRETTGISHKLVSLTTGEVIKTYDVYGFARAATLGTSSDKTPEKTLFRNGDKIFMSDLTCADTIYAIHAQDSLIHPEFIKRINDDERQYLSKRTYLYLLFDTPRYAQFVRYRSWADQEFYLWDRKEQKVIYSSLYSKYNKSRGRRTWWNVATGVDNTIVRIDLGADLLKRNRLGHYSGPLRDFTDKVKNNSVVLTVMTFNQ